jgi:hypothetical protein
LKQNKIGLEESKSTLVETASVEASLKQETPML